MPSSKGKQSFADEFTGHFDRDWSTQKSRIRDVRTERFNYSPNYSWDALSDEPSSFSKLGEKSIPMQTSRPCTLIGNRVIELEQHGGMEVLNVFEPPRSKSSLPLSDIQKDCGMSSHNIKGEIPFHAKAVSEGKKVIMEKNYGFNNYVVCPPKFKAEEVPDYYTEAGENGDKKLLNPTQRRNMMDFDRKSREANIHLKAAVNERDKLRASIAGPIYHRGVLMCDSNDNVNSEIYADRAKNIQEQLIRRESAHAKRTQNLIDKSGSMGKSNGDWGHLTPEDLSSNGVGFQSKGRVAGNLSFQQTKDRLFNGNTISPHREERSQNLRDMDLLGKNYNIVSGAAISIGQSQIPERVNKRLMHPSQHLLEGRNMQGSLRFS